MWILSARQLNRKYSVIIRFFVTKSAPQNEIKYTNTINLPKTKFPARLGAGKREEVQEKIRAICLNELYKWQRENLEVDGEFILHDGPPYANGDLHMGHAVNKILKDITLKNHIVNRRRVHYVPGWDCHGLPIELKAMGKKDVKDPVKIRETARKFATETIEKQKAEFQIWGVTANWNDPSSYYRTFDSAYIKNQLKIFYKLYDKGLIFRDLKPVYWSPSSKSALAEAELEYDQNYESPSLFLKLKIDSFKKYDNLYALIWTTTPWTLPANQAVCYNPYLKYIVAKIQKDHILIASDLQEELSKEFGVDLEVVEEFKGDLLKDLKYYHPLENDLKLPFLPGNHVQSVKGTGLVHTAPAHGPDDFLVFLENKMSLKNLIEENGCYNEGSPDFLKGKYALKDGNNLVLNHVQKDIVKLGKIVHSYPIDWRTKQPVMFRASDQWFINTDRLKEAAIKSIENVDIFPNTSSENSKNILKKQLEKRPYWCISRQRAWGVPIPVFYRKDNKLPIVHKEIIDSLLRLVEKNKSIDFWWSTNVEDLIPGSVFLELGLTKNDVVKGNDILDIWFDSGISWSSVLKKESVADLYLEGLDQFTGWFQSSLLTSIAARDIAPYKSIFVHGFTVDEKGMKMSKSVGNIIAPKDIIKQYGCDTLRWWISSHAVQHSSIPVSHKLLANSSENIQKIRSILKFILGVIGERKSSGQKSIKKEDLFHLDKYFLHLLSDFHDQTFNLYKTYQYNRAATNIFNFISGQLSGFYLHLIKDRLYCGSENDYLNLKCILEVSYSVICKSLWPIAPFLVEESWSYFDETPFYHEEVDFKNVFGGENSVKIIETALELKQIVNQQQGDVNSWNLDVDVGTNLANLEILKNLQNGSDELCEILQVASVKLREIRGQDWEVRINENESKLCPRCRRFYLQNSSPICLRCELVLKEKETQ